MQLPVFLTNCAVRALTDGCYYGLVTEIDKSVFTTIDLPAEYCRSNFKDVNGNDVMETLDIKGGPKVKKILDKCKVMWYNKYSQRGARQTATGHSKRFSKKKKLKTPLTKLKKYDIIQKN